MAGTHERHHGAGGHAGHSHDVSADADRGKLTLALAAFIFTAIAGAAIQVAARFTTMPTNRERRGARRTG